MTSASGQLIFNISSNGVTLPSIIRLSSERETKQEKTENVQSEAATQEERRNVELTTTGTNTTEELRRPSVSQQTETVSRTETLESSSQTIQLENPMVETRREASQPMTSVPPPITLVSLPISSTSQPITLVSQPTVSASSPITLVSQPSTSQPISSANSASQPITTDTRRIDPSVSDLSLQLLK